MMAPPALRNLKDCVMQSLRSGKVRRRISGSRFCGDGAAGRSRQLFRGAAAMRDGMREHDNEGDDAERRDGQNVVEHQGRRRIAWIFHFFCGE
jgi:hypothetical protein